MSTTAPTGPIRRLDAGDGLRAVAMLSIFVLHAFLDASPGALPDPDWADFGFLGEVIARLDLGLSIFFVLSGYLISRPFARAYVTGKPFPSTGRYLVNRALRILPAYWVTLALVLVYFGTRGSSGTDLLGLVGVGYLYNGAAAGFPLAQSWTLGCEIAFYVAVPLLCAAATVLGSRVAPGAARAALVSAGLLGLVALSLRWRHYAPTTSLANINNPLGIFYAFAPGVLVAALEPVLADPLRRDPARARQVAWGLLALSALGVLLYVVLEPYGYVALHHVRDRQAAAAFLFELGLLGGLLALQLGGRRARSLDNRVMVWLGERSYSFYLAHFGVMVALMDAMSQGAGRHERLAVNLVIGFPITLGLAHLMYHAVEKPFLDRRKSVSAPPVAEPVGQRA